MGTTQAGKTAETDAELPGNGAIDTLRVSKAEQLKVKMTNLNLCLVVFVCLVGTSYCSVMIGPLPCPDNHTPGDTWFPKGCQRCTCGPGGFECVTCGTIGIIYDKTNCYEVKGTGNYPACCEPKIICRGDPGFDQTKLA